MHFKFKVPQIVSIKVVTRNENVKNVFKKINYYVDKIIPDRTVKRKRGN